MVALPDATSLLLQLTLRFLGCLSLRLRGPTRCTDSLLREPILLVGYRVSLELGNLSHENRMVFSDGGIPLRKGKFPLAYWSITPVATAARYRCERCLST
jgi:hypothetical protein